MVARLSPLFEQAPAALSFVTIIGATTAFFAATVGLVQNDIKRVIAYSTCSQLGYMFVALGVSGYPLGIFHLFTHAFFKALLFLGAGSVIHAMHHEQDMRKMGGLARKIPVTFWMMIAGTLALTGFPLTSGFFSKDAIIEASFASHRVGHLYAFLMVTIAAGLTSFYSWRLIFMTFFGPAKWEHADAHSAHATAPDTHQSGHDAGHNAADHVNAAHHGHEEEHHIDPHESPAVMMIPLYVLAFGAIFAGAAFVHTFIGMHSEQFWKGALYIAPDSQLFEERVPLLISLLPTIFMVIGLLMALRFYIWSPGLAEEWAKRNPLLYRFLLNKWYFDELYDFLFVRPAFWLGRLFWKGGDQNIIDRYGPDGVAARVVDVTRNVVKLQSGYLYHYALAMLIGVAAFVTYYVARGLH